MLSWMFPATATDADAETTAAQLLEDGGGLAPLNS